MEQQPGAAVIRPLRLASGRIGGQAFPLLVGGAMLIGPFVALWAFIRLARPLPAPAATLAPVAVTAPPIGRGVYWPLAGAAVVYLVVAGLELKLGRFPAILADRTLRLEPAAWSQPVHLAYDLWNVANERVGTAECTLTPQAGAVAYACVTRQQSFKARQGQSYYAGG